MLSIQELYIPYFCWIWQQTVANSVNVTVVYSQTQVNLDNYINNYKS